ncbi:MAG: alpha/beta hydrolase [Chloroflexi bacterium]|nr:alpha/beta hydrolase [Chloroflexota bacterium]
MLAYHPFRSAPAKETYLTLYEVRAKAWPLVSETRLADTSYGQTFVRLSGPTGAQPLVLLPGMAVNSLLWAPNIKALAEHYRTYAVDNIYDGGRSVYTRPLKRPDDFVNWLDELFRALELGDNINLMGLSYGGWLTSQYALRGPNRLHKIVLLAPSGTVLPPRLEFLLRTVLCLLPHRRFIKSLGGWLFEDCLVQKDETCRKMGDDLVNDMFMALHYFKPKRLIKPTVLGDKELQSIRIPTLYLVGKNEKMYSAQKAVQRLSKVAPHIKAEIIPHAGHDLTFVQAELVNRKVLEFLQQG